MNPKVDAFMERAGKWRDEFILLRSIALSSGLGEELKWGQPCYVLGTRNIVLIHGFKDYCALLFFKGALMKDPERILIRQTENVQAARQIRFTGVGQIEELEAVLNRYIAEAIEIEGAGLTVARKTTADFQIPDEFQARLDSVPGLKTAFEALTPGRQRAYLFWFSQPKKPETREARVGKSVERILEGKGLDD